MNKTVYLESFTVLLRDRTDNEIARFHEKAVDTETAVASARKAFWDATDEEDETHPYTDARGRDAFELITVYDGHIESRYCGSLTQR